jgi:ribonuclease R
MERNRKRNSTKEASQEVSPEQSANRRKKASAEVDKSQLVKIFNSNPGKVFSEKQLNRRLGANDQAAREQVADFLKDLKKEGKVTMRKDGDYLMEAPATAQTEPKPGKNGSSRGKKEGSKNEGGPEGRGGRRGREGGKSGRDRDRDSSRGSRFGADDKIITGKVDLANNKYAYIVSEETEEDVRVFREKLLFAMDNDIVKVQLYSSSSRGGDRQEGEVVEIVERFRNELVGRIQVSKGFAFVIPDFKRLYFDVYVEGDDINEAQDGDKVLVRVKHWPTSPNKKPIGEVVRVFGPAGENEAEINAIMAEFGLPFDFPENVIEESEAISEKIPQGEIAKRRDFRDVTTFTIDPVDAKDFDDALSIRKLDNGHWEIGVHIADVTHYVHPRSLLEKEAYHRATSVYLVDRVIPMLPEKLSNGLCSLRPHEDKLTFAAVFELDENGRLHEEWIGKTVIHSDRRFAYEEAQEIMDAKAGEFAEELLVLDKIAKKLKDKRFKNGAISFETLEVKFKLDENGKPLSIYIKERKDVHKLIEEFMLLANRKVAEFVYNLKKGKNKNTMVYRIHDNPDPEKLSNFSQFAARFGYKVDVEKDISTELNNLAEQTLGKPEQSVLQSLAIRTMAKAKYSTEAKGHFGLAFKHYSHFTSPIRRYPDMMAHRLIEQYLQGAASADKEEYEEKCQHSSDMEKRAADAERASIKYKQVEFMQYTVGNQYRGIVSGVTDWGLYVEIQETMSEGMVRLQDMDDDFYELDAANYRIIGRRNKRIINFGDEVTVEVKAANLLDRTIDLLLVRDKPRQK